LPRCTWGQPVPLGCQLKQNETNSSECALSRAPLAYLILLRGSQCRANRTNQNANCQWNAAHPRDAEVDPTQDLPKPGGGEGRCRIQSRGQGLIILEPPAAALAQAIGRNKRGGRSLTRHDI
jgi:hypothetical protein